MSESGVRDRARVTSSSGIPSMALNKKQKKQIEAARNKLNSLKQQLAGARKQPDDPAEIPRLEAAIAQLETEIKAIQSAE